MTKINQVNFRFGITNRVILPKELLDKEGVVLSIYIIPTGIQYNVRYFWDGIAKEVYFYEWELREAPNVKR